MYRLRRSALAAIFLAGLPMNRHLLRVLDAYTEAGGNFIDTADVYSAWVPGHQGGESETILGKWMHARHNREQIVIATKVGSLPSKGRNPDLSREHILHAVEASLRRLQTDYIDVYFAHRDDSETPLGETLGTFAELVQAGKVRVLGASNYDAARMREALQISQTNGFPRYEIQQPLYNLISRDQYEGELQQLCVAEEISVVPYSSLASGFLTGKYRQNAEIPKTPTSGFCSATLLEQGKFCSPGTARSGRQPVQRNTSSSRPRLAARPSRRHCANCQRYDS